MFRLLKLKPPNGWGAVAWELVVVTLGVLLALAAQQWADDRSWRQKAKAARFTLKEELHSHHHWAVEWRMVAPCINAQLDRLQDRVLASGDTLDPAPVHQDASYKFVVRTPSRPYADSVWESSNNIGVSNFFEEKDRLELGWHYNQARNAEAQNQQIALLASRLDTLAKPIAVDAGVKLSLIQTIDELRGHNRWLTIKAGQLVDHLVKLNMVPQRDSTDEFLATSGTLKFCRENGFPTLPVAQALIPIPA